MRAAFLACGKLVATHGIHGELRVQSWCDSPEILTSFDTLYLQEGSVPLTVLSARVHKNVVILALEDITTLEQAQPLVGQTLFLRRQDFPLEEGVFFLQDLIGCLVYDHDQPTRCYGTLTEVSQPGANDVYHVKAPDGRELLVPVIPQVVRVIDPDHKRITITPLEGLFS